MSTFAALMTQKKRKAEGVVWGRPQKRHIRDPQTVEASIAHGERVVQFMRWRYGEDKAEDMLSDIAAAGRPVGRPGLGAVVINVDAHSVEVDPRERKNKMMWFFWRAFIEEEMQVKYDSRKRMRYLRALRFFLQRREEGAVTLCGLRGDRKAGSRRLDGGRRNRVLCPALGLHLLQYFTDHVHQLNCRTDSHLLMQHARELRAYLIAQGTPETELPKLIGNPGAAWFRRWRLGYGIHMHAGWMKLKVSWKKVKHRVGVYLSNIFRLRALWEKKQTKGSQCASSAWIRSRPGSTTRATRGPSTGEGPACQR